MQLREYQLKAIYAIYDYFNSHTGHALVVMPTGTGKSLVIAALLKDILSKWPTTRIVIPVSSQELVEQNYLELKRLWPDAPAGIVSAGLGKKQFNHQVVFCSIQSIWRHAYVLQKVDLVIPDECHGIPKKGSGMWLTFIENLRKINPKVKLLGLSATIFRLDSGLLHKGEGRIFTDVAYEYKILDAVKEGYLCELVSVQPETKLNVTGVHKRGGDFISGELEKAIDTESTTLAAVREIVKLGADRKSWLVFCAGIQHCEHVRDALRTHGVAAEMLTGKTPKGERAGIIDDFKSGKIRALVNVNILVTGFNHPGTDLIADLYPTQSAGRHIQKLGRGMRNAPGKANCIIADFSGGLQRFGPIDQIVVKDTSTKGGGDMPQKTCPHCMCFCHMSARTCPDCNMPFEFKSIDEKLSSVASNAAVLSTQIRPTELPVKSWELYHHEKAGSAVSLRVAYRTGVTVQSEWICLQHMGFARNKAVAWWAAHGGQLPPPATVSEAISRKGELNMPRAIITRPSGKYTEIVGKLW